MSLQKRSQKPLIIEDSNNQLKYDILLTPFKFALLSLLLYKNRKKQVSEILNTLKNNQVFFKQISVACKRSLTRKNKKQEKNQLSKPPLFTAMPVRDGTPRK